MTEKLKPLRIGDVGWGADVELNRLALKVNQLVDHIEGLETQVRLMEKILEKLVTLHPEAQEQREADLTETCDCASLVPPAACDVCHPEGPYRSSQDDFYAHRKALVDEMGAKQRAAAEREAEDLYLQRRRNFPLDPPSSCLDDDDGLGPF